MQTNKFSTGVLIVTPEMAKDMLKNNMNNRTLRKTRVTQYAEQIRRGQWQLTGEAIKFSTNGLLLDGQHRLHAVVEAQKPATFLVVFGLEPDTFKVLDSGLNRKPADVLRAIGVTDASNTAAIVRLYLTTSAGLNPCNTNAMQLTTRADIAEFVEANQDLVKRAVSMCRHCYDTCVGNRSAWGALYLLISTTHSETDAAIFMETMCAGVHMDINDPRLALRNWAIRNGRGKMSAGEHLGTYVRAWNAHANKKPMQLLRQHTGDKPFPVLK